MRGCAGVAAATLVTLLILGSELSHSGLPSSPGFLIPFFPRVTQVARTDHEFYPSARGKGPATVGPLIAVPTDSPPGSLVPPLVRVIRGTASTYGPGYDGRLALPTSEGGRGEHVRICGPVACITRTSNDVGPVARLHRVADLDVADFETVCGCSWHQGLVHVEVTFL